MAYSVTVCFLVVQTKLAILSDVQKHGLGFTLLSATLSLIWIFTVSSFHTHSVLEEAGHGHYQKLSQWSRCCWIGKWFLIMYIVVGSDCYIIMGYKK